MRHAHQLPRLDSVPLTASCPLECFTGLLSEQAYQPLRRALTGTRPEPTLADVVDLYLSGALRGIRRLGPRRAGEIELWLMYTGLLCWHPNQTPR